MDDKFFKATWATADVSRIYLVDHISIEIVDTHGNFVNFFEMSIFLCIVIV